MTLAPPVQAPRTLRLVSHALCPYVQRAAIVLLEKGVPFTRVDVDLAQRPAWFVALSPLGRTPLLLVDQLETTPGARPCLTRALRQRRSASAKSTSAIAFGPSLVASRNGRR